MRLVELFGYLSVLVYLSNPNHSFSFSKSTLTSKIFSLMIFVKTQILTKIFFTLTAFLRCRNFLRRNFGFQVIFRRYCVLHNTNSSKSSGCLMQCRANFNLLPLILLLTLSFHKMPSNVRKILVYVPSKLFYWAFVFVQASEPYGRTGSQAAMNNLILSLN